MLLVVLGAIGDAAGDPPAPAGAPAKPLTPEQGADAVLAALRAKDDAALRAAASRFDPDPWRVADHLLARGEADAAEALAKASPSKDLERLPAYVAARRGAPDDPAARAALAAARTSLAARDAAGALAAIDGARAEEGTIVSLLLGSARAAALRDLRRLEESVQAYVRAGEAFERVGWIHEAARSFHEAGAVALYRSDLEAALTAWTRCLAVQEARGSRIGTATVRGNLGNVHYWRSEYDRALEHYERARREKAALGDRRGAVETLANIGSVYGAQREYGKALEVLDLALAEKRALGDRSGAADTLANIGVLYFEMGRLEAALDAEGRALAEMEALGNREGAARTRRSMGLAYKELGQYVRALELHERALADLQALGDRQGVAQALGGIGVLYGALGDGAKALAYQERALRAHEAIGDRHGMATAVANMAAVARAMGDHRKSIELSERALGWMKALGDRTEVARITGNLGAAHASLGDHASALVHAERAREALEALGDRSGAALALANVGVAQAELGDVPKAIGTLERAVGEAERLLADAVLVQALRASARWRLAAGDPQRAVEDARRAIAVHERMLAGLGDEQGALGREQSASAVATGVRAATVRGDVAEVAFFLESGRGIALLELMRTRRALRDAALPEPLRAAEESARAAEAAAVAAYRRALDGGDLATLRALRQKAVAAQDALGEVVGRIQREAKRAANLLYPRPDALERIQGRLAKGDALVLYGLFPEHPMALVVTRGGARVAGLPPASEIEAAVEGLDASRPDSETAPALAAIRKAVVEPLALGKDVSRVLVSPDGALSYVPFAAVFEGAGIDVAYEPSGTTLGHLSEEATGQGQGVLALGDPDYGTSIDDRALAVVRGGQRLVPLPATRAEATVLGTRVLLGAEASEAGLRAALGQSARWRAVHLACHGLVEPERPMLSSLALTATGGDDGFLTALDVFGMRIPADLAVLSACETGKGRIVRGEGVLGLARAFMFAGAPRVLCSLWKVDDEATRALMVKFYELWNPREGAKPMGAAAALAAAQAHVREQPKWKHPYYWAAWVLWGLPD